MSDEKKIFKNMICAVITTYRPDDTFVQRINRVMKQVGYIVIVNDSGLASEQEKLKKTLVKKAYNTEKIAVVNNEKNFGQAKSLNIGVKKAEYCGYKYILTLDDDTIVFDCMVERLIIYYKYIQAYTHQLAGVVALSWIPIGSSEPIQNNSLKDWHEKRGVITSGSFFSVVNYRKIGPFRDDFIIDFVDYDFCLRARSKGFKVYKINEPGFWHSIGKTSGGQRKQNNKYASKRIYYSVRNGWILFREQLFKDPLFSIAMLKSQILLLFGILFDLSKRERYCKYIFQGIADAMHGKMGKYMLN